MKLPQISIKSKVLEFFTIIVIWISGYLLYGTTLPYDYDSVSYALGIIEKFDVVKNKPHPPGYFFHILLGKFIYLFSGNPFETQQIENIFYLTILLLILFLMQTNRGVCLFLCTLPLFLFFVGAPVHYAALAGFSGLISYLLFFTIDNKCSPVWMVVAFSIAIGFRQDISLFLLPSILYAIWRRRPSKKEILLMVVIFITITLIWFIPTCITTEEYGKPFILTMNFFFIFSKGSSFFLNAPLKEAIRCGLRFILFSIAVFGPGGLVYLILSLGKARRQSILLLLIGVMPSFLFGVLFHGPKPGYYGIIIGFFLVWSLKFALPSLKPIFLALLICTNILFFILAPSYSSKLSLQAKRPTSYFQKDYYQKAKNLLYASIGRNSMKELLYYRDLHQRADSIYKGCNCVYDEKLDSYILSYFTSYVWHNQIDSSSWCCRNKLDE